MKGMKKKMKRKVICCMILMIFAASILCGCSKEDQDTIILRVNNVEEYIDLGGWSSEEAITLDDGTVIMGENSLVEDYEEWFYETYGKRVKVEYSTYGTNEELYNQITMGDTYDLICPSEYMIMKMMSENMLEPYSEEFFDCSMKENYYAQGVSPYVDEVFHELAINGEPIHNYAAGYMWGTLGIVYNPEEVSEAEAFHWSLLLNPKFQKRVTIKDSVRDAYFAGNSIYNEEKITAPEFMEDKDYADNLSETLNATDQETVDGVEEVLSRIKDNVYSFETDSGKADMVSGKVVANQQWSGDAVFTMAQAAEDGVYLCYSAPEEATNLWFDGWCMMKEGIAGDQDKKLAAEAFVNFISRPDNVVRNMYYIGYTSVISGGDSDLIYQYLNYNYGVEESEDAVAYPLGYFFAKDGEDTSQYVLMTSPEQTKSQLFAQYPTEEVMKRCVVMAYFDKQGNERINHMWTNVRCFDIMQRIKEWF